jgi:hypothetical protein
MMQQCCVVEPFLNGFTWVKYVDDNQPVKLYHKEWRRCTREATITYFDGWLTFHWCQQHSQAPVCNVPTE